MLELEIATADIALSGVASNASGSMLDMVRCFYVLKYQSYIEDLKEQVEDLTKARGSNFFIRVNEFSDEGKGIVDNEDEAKKWPFEGLCRDVMRDYLRTKKAVKEGMNAVNILQKGVFDRAAYGSLRQRLESMYLKAFEPLDSTISKCHDTKEALKDANVTMIGLYGMGGVGTTRIIKVLT